MFVLVMPVVVGVLMGMHHGLMAVLMPVVDMVPGLVLMLVLMLIFAVATHLGSPPFYTLKDISAFLNVKETLAKYPANKSPGGRNYPEKKLTFRSLSYNFDQTWGMNPILVLTNPKLDEPATKAYGAASAKFLWLFFRHSRKGKFWGQRRYGIALRKDRGTTGAGVPAGGNPWLIPGAPPPPGCQR